MDNYEVFNSKSLLDPYLNNITEYQVLSAQRQLFALTNDGSELGYHVLERFHNLR